MRSGLLRLLRVVSLVMLAGLGTIALMRAAPGYFTDTREMDAQTGEAGRRAVEAQAQSEGSVWRLMGSTARGWLHGDLGRSRQFDMPASELMRARIGVSARLLGAGLLSGWLIALCLALLLSARRTTHGEAMIAAPCALLMAVPVGALATLCLVANCGGPVLVLATLIGVREFKLLYRLLRRTWRGPHFLYARAQGIGMWRLMRIYLVPELSRELLALSMTSLVVALSMLVPVEVIFDAPGLGQLAWSAAMNRDLPVLLAVTLLMAACVGIAGMLANRAESAEIAECA